MARTSTHKDVEYAVGNARDEEQIFTSPESAAGFAVVVSMATGRAVDINVLISSRAGAHWYGGDDAAEQYDEDPDTSVFERIVVRAESTGRVP